MGIVNEKKPLFVSSWKQRVINICIIAALLVACIFCVRDEGFHWPQFFSGIGLLAAIAVVLNLNFRIKKAGAVIVLLLIPPVVFYLLEAFSHNAFVMSVPLQLLNIAFFYILMCFLLLLTGSGPVSGVLTALLPMLVGVVNYYTVCFRSSPILPWDLLSLKTAMSVTSNYKFSVEFRLLVVALGFVLVMAIASKIQLSLKESSLKRKLIQYGGALVCVIAVGVMIFCLQLTGVKKFFALDETLFTPNVLYRNNGFTVSFLYNLQFIQVKKPQGYSLEAVAEVMAPYMEDDAQDTDADPEGDALDNEERPNIIVIMNEAFSDLSVLGDFETNEDYMPFTRSLTENTVKGNLFVSVKGGNTANSEFEFLTGNSMAFLPQGSVAYQQYIHDALPGMVTWLNALGYMTAGMHPYYASGWDRDEVYPFLGFEKTYFINDFKHKEILRKYVSDRSAFAQIVDLYEEKAPGEPLFAFEVTMQNHGGYYQDYDNFTPDITLGECGVSKKVQHYSEQYLSLVRESDRAFEALINYFAAQDEKTVVVMFGDHQPADIIAKPMLSVNDKLNDTSVQAQQARYQVPFVIWANYDIEEKEIERISLNYLGALVMETAGLPLSGYQKFLLELSEELPVITGNVYIDAKGDYYTSADNPYSDKIELYRMLQYYYLFDDDQSLKAFYGADTKNKCCPQA